MRIWGKRFMIGWKCLVGMPYRTRSLYSRLAWVLAVAVFVQAIMPYSLALAFQSNQDTQYQFICTAEGIKQIPLETDGAPANSQVSYNSCPFCLLQKSPAAIISVNVVSLVSSVDFLKSYPLPVTSHYIVLWNSVPPPSRAPPLFV